MSLLSKIKDFFKSPEPNFPPKIKAERNHRLDPDLGIGKVIDFNGFIGKVIGFQETVGSMGAIGSNPYNMDMDLVVAKVIDEKLKKYLSPDKKFTFKIQAANCPPWEKDDRLVWYLDDRGDSCPSLLIEWIYGSGYFCETSI